MGLLISTINKELIYDFKKEINFKIEKVSNLYISNKNSQSLPSLISIEFGADNEEVYSFKVGNNLWKLLNKMDIFL